MAFHVFDHCNLVDRISNALNNEASTNSLMTMLCLLTQIKSARFGAVICEVVMMRSMSYSLSFLMFESGTKKRWRSSHIHKLSTLREHITIPLITIVNGLDSLHQTTELCLSSTYFCLSVRSRCAKKQKENAFQGKWSLKQYNVLHILIFLCRRLQLK